MVDVRVKIHTVFITYNRLELTRQAIESYLETVSVPFSFVVYDNASSDGTCSWLEAKGYPRICDGENRYPGFATNHGWASRMSEDTTHLHRADNDFIFLPGWCEEVKRCFRQKSLGQLGLRTDEEEDFNAHNVGGNCIIRRQLWDEGLRWDERPWPQIKTAGFTEDSYFSPAVERMGWTWGRVRKPCIYPISVEDLTDEYYRKSWADRGIFPASQS